MAKRLNLIGQRFGYLVVISESHNKNTKTSWLCKCDCGNTKVITTEHLRKGMTKSCGCNANIRTNKSIKTKNGYVFIYMPEHPKAFSNGCVYEHILIAEKILGRYLNEKEIVHHKDKKRFNNNPDNLMIFRTDSDHARFHKTGIAILQVDGTYISPIKESITRCINCGKEIYRTSTRCNDCSNIARRKANRPSLFELQNNLKNMTYSDMGRKYGVSSTTIKRWLKDYK